MRASGARRKREAVEVGLRTLERLQQQGEIRAFRGQLHWKGSFLYADAITRLIHLARTCCSAVIWIGWWCPSHQERIPIHSCAARASAA